MLGTKTHSTAKSEVCHHPPLTAFYWQTNKPSSFINKSQSRVALKIHELMCAEDAL